MAPKSDIRDMKQMDYYDKQNILRVQALLDILKTIDVPEDVIAPYELFTEQHGLHEIQFTLRDSAIVYIQYMDGSIFDAKLKRNQKEPYNQGIFNKRSVVSKNVCKELLQLLEKQLGYEIDSVMMQNPTTFEKVERHIEQFLADHFCSDNVDAAKKSKVTLNHYRIGILSLILGRNPVKDDYCNNMFIA